MDDTDWKQNLLLLELTARRRGFHPLCVLDPRLSEAELHSAIPDAVLATPAVTPVAGLPRWCVVDVVVEQYFPAIERARAESLYDADAYKALVRRWGPLWDSVRKGKDGGYIANTYHLYDLKQ